MTRKRRRLWILVACGIGVGSASALALSALSSNLVFFVSPSQLAHDPPNGRLVRLGGLVQQGSVQRSTVDGKPTATFAVTDGKDAIKVTYVGILPDLFRQGQGVVVEGVLQPDGVFHASDVLAKHDANYMPKDVEEALKKSGRWNPNAGEPPPAATWDTMSVKRAGG
ncbi:MAG TPA: cytochrome c maturation protein CcmE [Acetobacteraceae bacterium]|jgi:cytochrome c-type biogenesis protein CcmE|nr:cytochrome c maturation protein CcmE [Acetobacteraceae bacterium]